MPFWIISMGRPDNRLPVYKADFHFPRPPYIHIFFKSGLSRRMIFSSLQRFYKKDCFQFSKRDFVNSFVLFCSWDNVEDLPLGIKIISGSFNDFSILISSHDKIRACDCNAELSFILNGRLKGFFLLIEAKRYSFFHTQTSYPSTHLSVGVKLARSWVASMAGLAM